MVASFNSANNKQSSAQVTSTASQRNRNTVQPASRALNVSTTFVAAGGGTIRR